MSYSFIRVNGLNSLRMQIHNYAVILSIELMFEQRITVFKSKGETIRIWSSKINIRLTAHRNISYSVSGLTKVLLSVEWLYVFSQNDDPIVDKVQVPLYIGFLNLCKLNLKHFPSFNYRSLVLQFIEYDSFDCQKVHVY